VRGEAHEETAGRADVLDKPSTRDQPLAGTMSVNPPPASAPSATSQPARSGAAALFPERDAQDLRRRWSDVQTAFVDEPRKAVEQADSLVAEVMKRLADVFAHERQTLEGQWDRGGNVTTEDLRVALQKYRSFFDRLLAV